MQMHCQATHMLPNTKYKKTYQALCMKSQETTLRVHQQQPAHLSARRPSAAGKNGKSLL